MSTDLKSAIVSAGQTYVRAIESVGRTPMVPGELLDLLDEITDWIVQANVAQDVLWNRYYEEAARRHWERTAPPAAAPGEGASQ